FEEFVNGAKSISLYTFWLQKLLQNKLCVYHYEAVVYSIGTYIPVKQRENTHHLSLFVLNKIFAEYTQPGHSKEFYSLNILLK
uniref:Uncharacterized protein n=1 Tax=Amphimedon queenslandica TaxID=400682 RepID=A0A1X7TMI8_AMPQE